MSPSASHFKQTRSTLLFATDARLVRNNASVRTPRIQGSHQALQAELERSHAQGQDYKEEICAWVSSFVLMQCTAMLAQLSVLFYTYISAVQCSCEFCVM